MVAFIIVDPSQSTANSSSQQQSVAITAYPMVDERLE
jgi:hypothetical protein